MAQSASRTPLGQLSLSENGANPNTELKIWLETLKRAVMASKKLHVDKLLKLKPGRTDLFYPTLPKNSEPLKREAENEYRAREQRNEKKMSRLGE